MILRIWPQILLTHFLKKTPIFSKSNRRRALGPTFLGSLQHFTSKAPHAEQKKYFFKFFSILQHENVNFSTFLTTTLENP